MGVKDLLSWVRKTHPQAITQYPLRWASPELKGKKVAIDATLLTNRYHFASRDGPHKGKGEIVGWYNLISEMRAYGVKPVAIWDQRGVREWKAPEALRRLAVRGAHLARRNHEFDRSSRLESLREVLQEFQSMHEEEKDIVRAHWETTRFMFLRPREEEFMEWETSKAMKKEKSPPIASLPPPISIQELPLTPPPTPPLPEGMIEPSKSAQLSSTLSEADAEVIDRVVNFIDTLAPLVQEYRESHKPSSKKDTLETDGLGLGLGEGIVEMEEELREWVPSKSTSLDVVEDDRVEKVEELDQALSELVPSNRVGETPRQMALTLKEGEIISSMLSTPPSPPFKEIGHLPTPPSSPTIDETYPEIEPDPLERLDDLISDLPSVRAIYERALDIPSAADHEDCKELLRIMGVPVLEAKIPYEAEGLASALAKNGFVDFVGTEDSDVLAYEGPLLKHLSPITSHLSLITGPDLRQLTGLSPSAYLDFLVLLGTDASPRIPKIGPVSAIKLIKSHGSIESILEKEPKIADRIIDKERFMEMVNNARKVFTELPPTSQYLEEGNTELEEMEWNDEDVERLLEERHGIKLIEARQEIQQEYI
ncbi:uncharacterized protein IL334_002708 [Kwoniella shivajii]|uniref:Exonuclease 1 n=1 Tax=Kwoniella shivajii TaxID=564305 RepID=A0ABZ1CWS8_9TREE|nr:hypothetical protein IL334_002708 [Kwoniella shivajii]